MESLVAPVIRKLANPQFKMNEHQVGELYAFVAITYVRVPAWREYADTLFGLLLKDRCRKSARNREEFFEDLKEFEDLTGDSVGDYEKAREFLLSGKFTITQNSTAFNLGMTLESGLKIAEVFLKEYKRDIYYAPADMFFMTCDNPTVTMEPDFRGGAFGGVGVGRPRTEVVFP